jgi:ATP-dependent DNA ligase
MAGEEFPDWIVPMAATLTQDRFTGPDWVFERKFDGIRLLAFKRDGEVRLFSRNRLPQHIPPIANAVAALPPADLILDGSDPLRRVRRGLDGWRRSPIADAR